VLYTPEHDATMASLGVDGVAKVVRLWADRTTALGSQADVASVLVFENRGAEVGATIAHPHGQIFAFDAVPPAVLPELDGPCAICQERPGTRLVTETPGWRAWVPAAPAWPFELLVVPDDHVGELGEVAAEEMAAILVDVLTRLDRLFGEVMPLMLWVHQRPTDGGDWPYAHVHVHIAPTHRAPGTPRFVAAGELGSGVFFNPVPAETAAERLRAVVL
jgi:UDPglucose--hexose-1-phosphate uridylyltransferase